jgi:hydrogenase expression/formation protein HypE
VIAPLADNLAVEPTTAGHRDRIALAHGGGGQLTDDLIQSAILPRLGNELLNELLDAAVVRDGSRRLVFSIDGYVVQPLMFPGGDIGRLAVCGTVNDLAVMGATPRAIALGMILAEGLERSVLDAVLDSIAATAREANVQVVTGDIKVVGRGQADGMYITTAGIGTTTRRPPVHPDYIAPGDVIIITGAIADHGLAVMLAREMPEVKSPIRSDVAPLNRMIHHVLKEVPGVTFMRDPTRGGVAGLCADVASRTGYHVRLDEAEIPIRPETLHAAEMLGLDPLEVANEGKVVLFVRERHAARALAALRHHPAGAEARVIGQVETARDGVCDLLTTIGGRRIVQKPYGEQLPRIC